MLRLVSSVVIGIMNGLVLEVMKCSMMCRVNVRVVRLLLIVRIIGLIMLRVLSCMRVRVVLLIV